MTPRVLILALLLAGCAAPVAPSAQPFSPTGLRAAQAPGLSATSADGTTLQGVVTLPPGVTGPVPVVLFIEGAGTWDADYATTLPGGRRFQVLPLQDLADACAKAGLGMVRYAKRGHDDPAVWATSTLTNLQADARAMLATVRKDPRFDAQRLAVVGHSEGTALTTWTATDAKAVALLSVVRRNLEAIGRDITVAEAPRTLKAFDRSGDGVLDEAELTAAVATPKGAALAGWRRADADRDGRLTPSELEVALSAAFDGFAGAVGGLAPTTLLTPTRWLQPAPAAWWHEHFRHAPAGDTWRRARTPVLVLHGEADPVTPYATEAVPLEAALTTARHPDHQLVGYAGLDHSFRDAKGESQAVKVFADLVPWLAARLAR